MNFNLGGGGLKTLPKKMAKRKKSQNQIEKETKTKLNDKFVAKMLFLVFLSSFLFLLSYFFEQYSALTLNFSFASIGLASVFLTDKYLMPGFDLVNELKEKNYAVAIAFFGLCYLIASCFSSK